MRVGLSDIPKNGILERESNSLSDYVEEATLTNGV